MSTNHIKKTLLALLLSSTTFLLADKIDKKEFLQNIAKQYLTSFVEVKKLKKTDEQRRRDLKREVYQLSVPKLDDRKKAKIIIEDVYGGENLALREDLEKVRHNEVKTSYEFLDGLHVFKGTLSKPGNSLTNQLTRPHGGSIEKFSTGWSISLPIFNKDILLNLRTASEYIASNPRTYKKLEHAFNVMTKIEDSLLSLYDDEDPMWSSAFHKELTNTFPHQKGEFVDWNTIEFKKRLVCDFTIITSIFAPVWGLFIQSVVLWLTNSHITKKFVPFFKEVCNYMLNPVDVFNSGNNGRMLAFGLIMVSWGFALYKVWQVYKKYTTLNNYISLRLASVQKLFEIAKTVNKIVKSNPILENACSLKHTRKLLACKHEFEEYNQLSYLFQTHNFTTHNTWVNAMATLITTMSKVKKNMTMLNEMIYEISKAMVRFNAARLVKNEEGYQNTFVFADFVDKPYAYLDIKGSWNTSVNRKDAQVNATLMDASKKNTLLTNGPNGCGKSQILGGFIEAPYLSMCGWPGPAQSLTMSMPRGFDLAKDPDEDPSRQMSLFMMQVNDIKRIDELLRYSDTFPGGFAYVFFDEAFTATNPEEGAGLFTAQLLYDMKKYPNSLFFAISHSAYVTQTLQNHPQVHMTSVDIDGPENGRYKPNYKLVKGPSKKRIGILVYETMSKNKEVAKMARKFYKEIMRKYKLRKAR